MKINPGHACFFNATITLLLLGEKVLSSSLNSLQLFSGGIGAEMGSPAYGSEQTEGI